MRSKARTLLQIIAPAGGRSENYLRGIAVTRTGVKMPSPMKAQIFSRLVFAAVLSFPGPVAARLLAAVPPDPTPTPAATSPAPAAAADAPPPAQVSAPPSAPAPAAAAS